MLRTGRIPLSTMRYYTGFAPGFQRGMRKITNLRPPAQRKRRIFVRIYNGRRKTRSGDMDLHCQELGKLIGRGTEGVPPYQEGDVCYRCTLVPVLPSMPWARPQAAGCAGSHGSDCQDGHRGLEAAAVQGMGRGKITGGLLYLSYPRCRGHAHRLPAAPGAVDQTVRTAIEG